MANNVKKTVGKPFEKGKSGNPGGRPKEQHDLRVLARERTTEALGALTEIVSDKVCSPAARVSAAIAILDRGYGKPAQQLEHTGPGGSPLETRLDPLEIARTIAFILSKAAKAVDKR